METATADSLQQIQQVLPLRWPSFNDTVPLVALIIGFLIYLIAYFAGGRQNKNKIIFAAFFCVVIGALCMPLFEKLENIIAGLFGAQAGWIISMLLFMAYLAGVGINMYEIITVTAREAHPLSEQW